MRKHRRSKSCFFSLRELFLILVIAGPVKVAYVPLGEDQAIRSSFLMSESGSGCAFTRGFFFNAGESDGRSFTR